MFQYFSLSSITAPAISYNNLVGYFLWTRLLASNSQPVISTAIIIASWVTEPVTIFYLCKTGIALGSSWVLWFGRARIGYLRVLSFNAITALIGHTTISNYSTIGDWLSYTLGGLLVYCLMEFYFGRFSLAFVAFFTMSSDKPDTCSNASICSLPPTTLPWSTSVNYCAATTTESSEVTVGWERYLCLKEIVSVIISDLFLHAH